MKLRSSLLLVLFLLPIAAHADEFLQTLTLPGNDCLGAVATLRSGNFIAAGVDYNSNDILWMRLSPNGTVVKPQRLSGVGVDEAQAVAAMSDGGAVIAGSTTSFGAGNTDSFLLKIAPSGAIAWKRTFGTSGNEHIVRIVQARDKGLIVLADADHDPNLNDIVVAKFSVLGNLVWRKVISAGAFDHPSDLQLTSDNGVIVAIGADLPSGVRSALVKLSATGAIQWSRIYGSSGSHVALSAIEAPDGGFYFTELFTPTGSLTSRTVLSRLDSSGLPLWSRSYQSAGVSFNASVYLAGADGNLLLSGNTHAPNGSNSRGILIGLNENGMVLWRKRVKPDARPVFIGRPQVLSTDDSILVTGCAGARASNNMDSLVLKTTANGTIAGGCSKLVTFPMTTMPFNLTSSTIVLEEIPVPFLTGQAAFQNNTITTNPSTVCSAE